MDDHRRDIVGILRQQNHSPPTSDILASRSFYGIVSPALLLVCKQIYHEAKYSLGHNQWRLNRWSTGPIPNISESVRNKVISVFLGTSHYGYFSPVRDRINGTSWLSLVKYLPNIQHLTIAMMEDDKGLSGNNSPEGEVYHMGHLAHYKELFQRCSIKSISLEYMKTYPSNMYQWVYLWSRVTTMAGYVLPLTRNNQKILEQWQLLDEVDECLVSPSLDWSGLARYRNYAPFLGSITESTSRYRLLSRRLQAAWEEFGFRVSARDPSPFERGTVIVFERISTGGCSPWVSAVGIVS